MFGLTSEIEVVLTDSFDMEMTVTKSRLNLVMTHFQIRACSRSASQIRC